MGSIPPSISSFNSLLELQLGRNQLSGHIPMMPSSLQIALNLSHNLFEGPIPNTLSRLSSLEVWDLSNNKFSGEIPIFLTLFRSMTQLLLSNNQLSGVIPKFGHWVAVDTSGNPGLVNTTSHPISTRKSQYKMKSVGSSVAVAVAVGTASLALGITMAILIAVSRSRRHGRVKSN